MSLLFLVSLLFTIAVHHEFFGTCLGADQPNNSSFVSILGDRGMTNPDARFALEAWNACNEVGEEAPGMGSPRMADCADLNCTNHDKNSSSPCLISQKVNDTANMLKADDDFPGNKSFNASADVDHYAVEKEQYLGSLCKKNDTQNGDWFFWMITVKNGNLDMNSTTCPKYGRKVVNRTAEMTWNKTFPCFDKGRCMNQPLVFRNESRLDDKTSYPSLTGMFYGSYDLDSNVTNINSNAPSNKSYFAVTWQKNITTNRTAAKSSWSLLFKLTTSAHYPWLSLFLRADAATGFNAGYPYDGRGIMNIKSLKSPNFRVRMNLHIIKGGGEISQFYLTNIGGCWKNNGSACDGDVTTDVTRYVQMIINPNTTVTCGKDNLKACPLYHTDTTTGEKIYKTNTSYFPYDAYHLYCAPGNAMLNDTEIDKCDPFTNPMQQELVQILPHEVWAKFDYPKTTQEVGWEGDSKFWDLNAGNLTAGMYFYQDPDYTEAAPRIWTSIMVGTEMYNLNNSDDSLYTAEWTISKFDVVVQK